MILMKKLPIIYSAHHASHDFGIFSAGCALSQEQRERYCDLGTDQSVPDNGLTSLVASASRGLVDLNRAPGDKGLFPWKDFGRPEAHEIWLPGKEPTFEQRQQLKVELYDDYHEHIDHLLTERCVGGHDTFVVAWDNTADYIIGSDSQGKAVHMPSIILSNNGDDGLATGQNVSCDSKVLLALGGQLSGELQSVGLPNDVYYNCVFRGGYITQNYTNFTRKDSPYSGANVQSLQVEYNMALTHNQKTLREDVKAIAQLKQAFSKAIERVLRSR